MVYYILSWIGANGQKLETVCPTMEKAEQEKKQLDKEGWQTFKIRKMVTVRQYKCPDPSPAWHQREKNINEILNMH